MKEARLRNGFQTVEPSETVRSVDKRHADTNLHRLIESIATGDQASLAALYDATNQLIFGMIVRVLRDTAAAEEILLDVYTQVWRQASQYDPERGSPLAWLITIGRSRAINRLRSRSLGVARESIQNAKDIASEDADPELASILSERKRLVRTALGTLPAKQRDVIELAYYSGLSHSEIAFQLGEPLGTVKTRTRLGMLKLREILRPLLDES